MNKVIIVSYLSTIVLYSVFSYLFIDPNLLYLRPFFTDFAFREREIVSVLFVASVLLWFAFYLLFISRYHNRSITLRTIMLLSSGASVIFLASYPAVVSYDIFNYITTAKILVTYGENPYLVMPIAFLNDPFLLYTHAANKVALYGPVWILLTSIPYLLSANVFLVSVYVFKLFVLLFFFGIAYLVWRLTGNAFSVLLFSLHPLILYETAASGHNDVVMMFFALLGIYFFKKKRILFAFISLFVSILVKFATIVLLPIFLFLLWKTYKKDKINWSTIYLYSAIAMGAIFLLSSFREEIYPWYATWFMTFVVLMPQRKFLLSLSSIVTCALFFRYIPFMYSGTHFGATPVIKTLTTFLPPLVFSLGYVIKKKAQLLRR